MYQVINIIKHNRINIKLVLNVINIDFINSIRYTFEFSVSSTCEFLFSLVPPLGIPSCKRYMDIEARRLTPNKKL